MGALAPIANLIGFSTGGIGSGGQSQTPPIDNFFGLDSRFLRSPAAGTALFNDILFGSSNQQVGIDFKRNGFYTGIPPIFGGQGFGGLAPRFDFFGGATGPSGVDGVLALERMINGGGSLLGSLSGASDSTGVAGNAGNKGTAASKSTSSTKSSSSSKSSNSKSSTPSVITDDVKSALKGMSIGDLLKLLA